MMNKIFLLLIFATSIGLHAQSSMMDKNNNSSEIINRFIIKSEISPDFHSSIKSFSIEDITNYMLKLRDSLTYIEKRDLEDIDFILKDNIDWLKVELSKEKYDDLILKLKISKKGKLKYFYKTPSSLYTVNTKNFFMKVDPVIGFNFGKDLENNKIIFQNTRGFKVSGLLDKKIYFYSSLFETQQSFLSHINRRIKRDNAIPGQSFFKKYNSSILNGVHGYDFLNAQAYIGFKITKSLSAQMGHGNFFIGNGIRSLFLSNYSHNYYYLKFDTRVWKFHYQNIFTEMSAGIHTYSEGDKLIPKKYMAMHYLSFRPYNNLELGLFETIIFSRNSQFELQYLNPVIIYRTVEHFIGSSDNVLLGLNLNYKFLHRFSVYSQLIVDEFNFSELKKNTDWWGNKYGFQIGFKYIDALGINNLDLQIESNIVRPYTYAHRDSTLSYSHYNQPLAHPKGANFKEVLFVLKYSPSTKLFFNSKFLITKSGEDIDNKSFGGNILISTDKRPIDKNGNKINYGYYTTNGLKRKEIQFSFNTSYMLFHNGFFDFNIVYRKEISDNANLNLNELYFGGGFRINFVNKTLDY